MIFYLSAKRATRIIALLFWINGISLPFADARAEALGDAQRNACTRLFRDQALNEPDLDFSQVISGQRAIKARILNETPTSLRRVPLLPRRLVVSLTDMITLGIRAKNKKLTEKPKTVFQVLPLRVLPLMATLPLGPGSVSILSERALEMGYPMTVSDDKPSDDSEHWIIEYRLQPNQEYQAVQAFVDHRMLNISEMISYASDATRRLYGDLRPSGRYAYFAPTWEEWGEIVGADGYTSREALEGETTITASLRQASLTNPNTAGLLYRIPLYVGSRHPDLIAPVFSRVQVTLDAQPLPTGHWLSFKEFERERQTFAHPPQGVQTEFKDWMTRFAHRAGFVSWVFKTGMLFDNRREWWGRFFNRRRTYHEGIDFALGRDTDGAIQAIPEGTPVESLLGGEVVRILDEDDFMAKSVLIRHPALKNGGDTVFYTLYVHIVPTAELDAAEGSINAGHPFPIKRGAIVGAPGRLKPGVVPVHLHLSWMWIPRSISPADIRWSKINPGFIRLFLVDPLISILPHSLDETPEKILGEFPVTGNPIQNRFTASAA